MVLCSATEARRFKIEVLKCRKSFAYFCDTYCQVLSDGGQGGTWVPFHLWPQQRRLAGLLQANRLVVVLKARQLGMTWLVLAFALWLMLFHPIATVLLFSRRDEEAADLLAVRLRGMYDRLPVWLQARGFTTDNGHEWALASGSRALAFPTTAGDSYTATLAVVDEADLCPDLDRLMRAVKPTIDGGGRMVLLSRSDKSKPESAFKCIYTAARQRQNGWLPVFLPWHARPDRGTAWYEAQRREVLARTGCPDDLAEQYPATDAEALAPRTFDKRIPADWLNLCFAERPALALLPPAAPALPGLTTFALPQPGHRYVIGADLAEGNPSSDDSALCVLDVDSGAHAAELAGKFEPGVFAGYAQQLAGWFNKAGILVERNNHGHAVLLWLRDNGSSMQLLRGHDGRPGWLSSTLGKRRMYDTCAEACKDAVVALHSFATYIQLASIEGSTLRAPDGQSVDRADAFALACTARTTPRGNLGVVSEGRTFADDLA